VISDAAETALDSAPPLDTGPDTGPCGTSDAGFCVTGILIDSETLEPVPGGGVCLLNGSTCAQTSTTGAFTITGVAATGSGLTTGRTGYYDEIWPMMPTSNLSGWTGYAFSSSAIPLGEVDASVGVFDQGSIHFQAVDGSGNNLAGVAVSTSPSGTVGYLTAGGGAIDPSLTATSSNGSGFVFDIAYGQVNVTFTLPGHTCVLSNASGWTAMEAGATMSAPVRPGAITFTAAACP
jgi:hypothetical protein